MGLNWSEGLLETSKGLKGLQAARERTLELDYRNRRDANLRRFTLEDQARDDLTEFLSADIFSLGALHYLWHVQFHNRGDAQLKKRKDNELADLIDKQEDANP